MTDKFKIAVLPGDGIGEEVISQAIKVITSIGYLEDRLELHQFDCGGSYYQKTGKEWSGEAEDFCKSEADVILLGAIGALDKNGSSVRLPDGNLAGYNVVLGLRFDLDLYANVRPVRLFEGVPTPLANKSTKDINMTIIRENTEGLYVPIRGRLARGGSNEMAIDTRIITRKGAERVIRYAFHETARRDGAPIDGKQRVTCVDKSNLLAGCQLFREVYDEVSHDFPDIETDYAYVDAWTQWVVKKPEYYDVVVAPNEFGDIMTDLGGAIQGGLGMAPAGNIGESSAVFEPVHGSAPKHAGKNTVNPIAAVLAVSMMLQWLGRKHSEIKFLKISDTIEQSIEDILKEGKIRTYDLCIDDWSSVKPSSTEKVGDEIRKVIEMKLKES
jgi:isocitrate/isopropylmalate dehydrogenase